MTDVSAHDATETLDCKTPGCVNDAVAKLGRYAGLCGDCIQRQRHNGSTPATPRPRTATSPATPRPGITDRLAAKVEQLSKLGREVDRLRARARKQAEAALQAKRDADQKEREFRALARELIGDPE